MSSANHVKDDRKYTKEHEWAKREGTDLVVGITAFAVDQLGDITLVSLDVKEGDRVEANKPFGTVESVKTLSDLFAPVAGTIKRVNEQLSSNPEVINEDCWANGWLVAIEPSNPEQEATLLDASAYKALLEQSGI